MKYYFVDKTSRRILGEVLTATPAGENPDIVIWQAPAAGLPAPEEYCTVSVDGLTVTADADWQAKERKKLVPAMVTEYQAKAALMQTPHTSGKDCYSVVEAFMSSPQATAQIKLAWATCRDYERLDDKIYLIASSVLAIPETDLETWLDDMFIKAKAIH